MQGLSRALTGRVANRSFRFELRSCGRLRASVKPQTLA